MRSGMNAPHSAAFAKKGLGRINHRCAIGARSGFARILFFDFKPSINQMPLPPRRGLPKGAGNAFACALNNLMRRSRISETENV
jgi:hypothetical protein